MKAYLEILRPGNCLMSIIAVLIGSFLILKTFDFTTLLASISVFLITGAGNAINDYIDIEADKVNRPKRPIPSGRIKPKAALFYSIVLFLIGIILSLFTTWPAFSLAIINSVLLIAYAFYLKNTAFVGNFVVSYLVGSTFLFGSLASLTAFSMHAITIPLLLMLLATLTNFSREVVKTLEDLEGDKKAFIKNLIRRAKEKILAKFKIQKETVEFRYSEKFTKSVAVLSLFIVIALSPIPYLLGFLGLAYLGFVILADLIFLYSATILFSKNKKRYSKSSKLIKLGMFVGLISYIVGVVF